MGLLQGTVTRHLWKLPECVAVRHCQHPNWHRTTDPKTSPKSLDCESQPCSRQLGKLIKSIYRERGFRSVFSGLNSREGPPEISSRIWHWRQVFSRTPHKLCRANNHLLYEDTVWNMLVRSTWLPMWFWDAVLATDYKRSVPITKGNR